jgi:hypothetical protein
MEQLDSGGNQGESQSPDALIRRQGAAQHSAAIDPDTEDADGSESIPAGGTREEDEQGKE